MFRRPFVLSCFVVYFFVGVTPTRAAQAADCRVGSYRLADGRALDIGPPDENQLRWRLFDGSTGLLHEAPNGTWRSTYGWTHHDDGKTVTFSCASSRLEFDGVLGEKIPLEVHDVTFESHGIKLAGRLVLPPGAQKVPVVVLVHGSEPDSALEDYSLQRMLPAQGVGAFVYDKRGTGKSQGRYTQDFDVLADDVVAAMREARRLAGARLSRIGYQAGSQGGWVAPIAASRAKVDFVIVCFGLAVSVIDEDQESVEIQLRERGYSPQEIENAQRVARAAEAVFASGFTQGFATLDALRAKYRGARWYKDLRGDFTWLLIDKSAAELRAMAATFDWHTPFFYDPMVTLSEARVPELWIIGGEDYDAPSAETRRRLELLIDAGRPFSVAYYPEAEHGITLFETAADGSRDSTRYAPGYFQMMCDFIVNGRLHGSYGNAELTGPAAAP